MAPLAPAVASLFLHLALLCAAPLLAGLSTAGASLASGRRPASPAAPYATLAAALRSAGRAAPIGTSIADGVRLAAFASTAVAAILVPSFATGTLVAPFDDVVTIASLLAVARLLDTAARAARGESLSIPPVLAVAPATVVFLPAVLALATVASLLGGTTRLDGAIEAAAGARAAPLALLVGAIGLLAVADDALADPAPGADADGRADALVLATDAVRRLVWLDLAAAFLLPDTVAAAGDGWPSWAIALPCWALKVSALALVLGFTRPFRRRWTPAAMLGGATLSASIGAMLLLIGQTLE